MNYILEGNLDFNSELVKAICNDNDDKIQKCLISNDKLEANHVTLKCNHKFNYINIFSEVFKQKRQNSSLETQKLNKFQIKCPYCRNIQTGILPFSHIFGKKERYVNWPPKLAFSRKKCQAIIRSGKRKGSKCEGICLNVYCHIHQKYQPDKICQAILKTGKKKGSQCSYKASCGNFCKRHFIKYPGPP